MSDRVRGMACGLSCARVPMRACASCCGGMRVTRAACPSAGCASGVYMVSRRAICRKTRASSRHTLAYTRRGSSGQSHRKSNQTNGKIGDPGAEPRIPGRAQRAPRGTRAVWRQRGPGLWVSPGPGHTGPPVPAPGPRHTLLYCTSRSRCCCCQLLDRRC
jgi:hypothetical protein